MKNQMPEASSQLAETRAVQPAPGKPVNVFIYHIFGFWFLPIAIE